MAHFDQSTITKTGEAMLNEMMAGRFIKITKAEAGEGTVDAGQLADQTALSDKKQDLVLTEDMTDEQGRTIGMQFTNASEGYKAQQVGVFGKLLEAKDGDPVSGYEEDKLFFILQDADPIAIPDESAPTFVLDLYTHLHINRETGRFEVSVSKTGIATHEYVERKIHEHDTNKDAHLIPDDNQEGTNFRLGVEDGKLYIQTVEEDA